MQRRGSRGAMRVAATLATAIIMAGCAGDDEAGESVASVPARAGEVWETGREGDRAAAAASMTAFANGLHVMVLDDDEAWTGMTRLRATRSADGVRSLTLRDGLTAELVGRGDSLELRLSSGERLPLHKRDPGARRGRR